MTKPPTRSDLEVKIESLKVELKHRTYESLIQSARCRELRERLDRILETREEKDV